MDSWPLWLYFRVLVNPYHRQGTDQLLSLMSHISLQIVHAAYLQHLVCFELQRSG